MSDKQWQIKCPHCQSSTQLNADQLSARHMIGAMSAMKDPANARRLLEDYTIACPRCDALMSFEPRSEYRRRKAIAVSRRIERLVSELESTADGERGFLAMAGQLGGIALQMLETDMPLETLYDSEDKLLSVFAEEICKTNAEPKRHRAWRWLQETFAIACSGIGERDDLPAAPVEDVEEKREAFLRSLEDLHQEQRPQATAVQPVPAADAKSQGSLRFHFKKAHDNDVEALAISRDGRIGLSVGWNSFVRVWNLETGQELPRLEADGSFLTSVIFLGDEKRVAAAGQSGALWIWDLASGRVVHCLRKHSFTIFSLAASADGRLLITGSGDGTARLWDTDKGVHVRKFGGLFSNTLNGGVAAVALSPDGTWALTGGGDCADTVKIWDASNGQLAKTAHFPARAISAVAFMSVRWKALVHSGSKLCVMDVTEGKIIDRLADSKEDYFMGFQLASGGHWAAAGSGEEVCVIEVGADPKNCIRQRLRGHELGKSINACAITPCGKRVLSGGHDLSVMVWDTGL
ncbi:MAG: WD40 repeat domain-containing protein [Prosthecobacter sp.]|uniref:WD40 repeat domain-containing protein n=1 Tax=Prosthecobacter sp. TaxID=1965333 RepID=UPI002603E289|nr:WD40 repeat domain-containing protein [Prosthecobacter sp.]MCF7788872.1 WD40 repeat domain-containing protein [Prosthecobacter sp.]